MAEPEPDLDRELTEMVDLTATVSLDDAQPADKQAEVDWLLADDDGDDSDDGWGLPEEEILKNRLWTAKEDDEWERTLQAMAVCVMLSPFLNDMGSCVMQEDARERLNDELDEAEEQQDHVKQQHQQQTIAPVPQQRSPRAVSSPPPSDPEMPAQPKRPLLVREEQTKTVFNSLYTNRRSKTQALAIDPTRPFEATHRHYRQGSGQTLRSQCL